MAAALVAGTVAVTAAGPHWETETSGVTARLRGVSASSAKVVWASGSGGTILRTADGGATWNKLTIAGAEKLDFRDIDAIDEKTAYALSIGNGASSRIYKTTDAGAHWTAQFQNPDPTVFLDAMTFAGANHGFVMGDSIAGAFVILSTADGAAQRGGVRGERDQRRDAVAEANLDRHGRVDDIARAAHGRRRQDLEDCRDAAGDVGVGRHLFDGISRSSARARRRRRLSQGGGCRGQRGRHL
jgi:photosystem II stability/assembly factor-like uncharacterized protein